MPALNYYEKHCGDYARKTAHLSLMQHGAYNVLLDVYYSTGRPLPPAYVDLYRIARAMTKDEQQAVRAVADEFFPLAADGLRHNERADEEIAKAAKRIATAKANGARNAVKSGPSGNPAGDPPGMPPGIPPTGPPADPAGDPMAIPAGNPAGPYGEASTYHLQKQPLNPKPPLSPSLPPNLPPEAWARWLQHRREIRAEVGPTEAAGTLAKLRLYADPEAAIDRAISGGYRAIAPPPETRHPKRNGNATLDAEKDNIRALTGQETRHERTIEGTAERVGRADIPALPHRVR